MGLTVPQNPQLPNAGETVSYYNITPAAAARGAQSYQTFETDFASPRTQYWHGVDANINARLRNGLTLQGGTSTGRGVRNTCELWAALPELVGNQSIDACAVTEPFMTWFRGLVAYTVPKADVLVSASMRSVPGAALGGGSASASNGTAFGANANVPNLVVQQTLGRLPANGLPTGTTVVNMLLPTDLYGPRVTQVDMRINKVLRFGRTRANVGIDLYNLFNTSDTSAFIQTFDWATNGATWLRPSAVIAPRFVRFQATFDF